MKDSIRLLALLVLACLAGCETDDSIRMPDVPNEPIVIFYENDVHCAVDGYAKLAGLRNRQKETTPYVTTVSCGDFVQGDVVGSVSEGESIVDIMNVVGYDVVTLGNHEFDFGMSQMFKLAEALDATVVDANFCDLRSGEFPFPAYRIIRYGEVDIAYLGLTTTTTPTNVSPMTFQDGAGNVIYDFSRDTFYPHVQSCIDKARSEGADYVVALSHLGDMNVDGHPNSLSLIAQTNGIDVVLDGHDHHVIPDTLVHNSEGDFVLLTSTGTKFEYVGLLTLSTDGVFTSRLVPTEGEGIPVDEGVRLFVEDVKQDALAEGERVIGYSDVPLSIYDEDGKRIIRCRETAIGNLCTDAFRITLNTDVALINGGGIRADLLAGDITYNHLLSVFPFNNTACTATMTGQQLLDALELSVSYLPDEDGSFMQVSGMKFEVDASVPSPVVLDEQGLFSHVEGGGRRVGNLRILDKDSGTYQPVDLDKRYTLASFDYQLKELGSAGIFRYTELKDDNLGQDVEVLSTYIQQTLGGRIGMSYGGVEGRIVLK